MALSGEWLFYGSQGPWQMAAGGGVEEGERLGYRTLEAWILGRSQEEVLHSPPLWSESNLHFGKGALLPSGHSLRHSKCQQISSNELDMWGRLLNVPLLHFLQGPLL